MFLHELLVFFDPLDQLVWINDKGSFDGGYWSLVRLISRRIYIYIKRERESESRACRLQILRDIRYYYKIVSSMKGSHRS